VTIQIKTEPNTSAAADGMPRILGFKIINNGKTFSSEDFQRMSTIAEGNPHADKVGMFGVGKILPHSTTCIACY
jgi:hypothetical protein